MSNLTGQQIRNTYEGLLNLQDSTTGITSNLQAIQDGLGNNTGARIATNFFTAPNVPNLNMNLIPDMMGTGVGLAQAGTNPANSQNRIAYNIFWDSGVYSYSAVTYYLSTLSSTSDVVDLYFYTLQLVPGIGIAPKDLVMSGITLNSVAPATTGYKTAILPSTLSFSGTGGGFYVVLSYIQNAGVTPTVRYAGPQLNQNQIPIQPLVGSSLGMYEAPAGLTQSVFVGHYRSIPSGLIVMDNLTPKLSYTESDIINNQTASALVSRPNFGFGLKVIK
jgi:hypothetical protein